MNNNIITYIETIKELYNPIIITRWYQLLNTSALTYGNQ